MHTHLFVELGCWVLVLLLFHAHAKVNQKINTGPELAKFTEP
jgi:hypothetical protein